VNDGVRKPQATPEEKQKDHNKRKAHQKKEQKKFRVSAPS
jgi:hypothetical protein